MEMLRKYTGLTFAAALLMVGFAVFNLVRNARSPAGHEAIAAYYEDLARQCEEVTEHLADGAKVVVLVYNGEMEGDGEKNFKGIFRRLKKGGPSIIQVERLVWDDAMGWHGTMLGFPYKEFLRVAREYPDAEAILSLCGVPYDARKSQGEDGGPLPPLLVTRVEDRLVSELDYLLQQGRVAAAVVSSGSTAGSGSPGSEGLEVIFSDTARPSP